MPNFHTHITISTTVGVGYATVGHVGYDMPLPMCILAGGLTALAGVLPDLDSDSSIPIREVLCLAAAVTPMLMLDRLQHIGLSHSAIVVASACIYIIVRFGLGDLLRAITVHRGMFHSIPAAIIAGLAASIICSCEDVTYRYYKVMAVVLGYMTHLMLDELNSVTFARGFPRLKKSFGTATKFWGNRLGGNLATYGLLLFMVAAAVGDPLLMEHFGYDQTKVHRVAHDTVDRLTGHDRHHQGDNEQGDNEQGDNNSAATVRR